MNPIVKILATLGIAKPKRSLYSSFEQSIANLDRQVKDINVKIKAANGCLEHIQKDELAKGIEVLLKGIRLSSVSTTFKNLNDAMEKKTLDASLKAIPRRNLYRDIVRAVENVLDDIPDAIEKSGRCIETGTDMVTNKIPNCNENGLTIAVTVAEAKSLVTKAQNLKKNIDELKTQGESLKKNAEAMAEKAEAEGGEG